MNFLPLLLRVWYYPVIAVLAGLAWHFDSRAIANANALRSQAASLTQAQRDADALWQKKIADQKAQDRAEAKEADDAYQSKLADARDAIDRYISTHRMRSAAPQGSSGSAAPVATAGGAGVPQALPPDAVVVSPDDLHRCTDAVTYALQAHAWAAKPESGR